MKSISDPEISDLPSEVLHKIFRKLDLESLLSLSQTNSSLRRKTDFTEIATHPDWRRDFLLESKNHTISTEMRLELALNRKGKYKQHFYQVPYKGRVVNFQLGRRKILLFVILISFLLPHFWKIGSDI